MSEQIPVDSADFEAVVDAIQKLTEVVNALQERVTALEAKSG